MSKGKLPWQRGKTDNNSTTSSENFVGNTKPEHQEANVDNSKAQQPSKKGKKDKE